MAKRSQTEIPETLSDEEQALVAKARAAKRHGDVHPHRIATGHHTYDALVALGRALFGDIEDHTPLGSALAKLREELDLDL